MCSCCRSGLIRGSSSTDPPAHGRSLIDEMAYNFSYRWRAKPSGTKRGIFALILRVLGSYPGMILLRIIRTHPFVHTRTECIPCSGSWRSISQKQRCCPVSVTKASYGGLRTVSYNTKNMLWGMSMGLTASPHSNKILAASHHRDTTRTHLSALFFGPNDKVDWLFGSLNQTCIVHILDPG